MTKMIKLTFRRESDGGTFIVCCPIRQALSIIEKYFAIDNIVLDEGWEIVDSGMVESIKSDHNLLWAEIHYKG